MLEDTESQLDMQEKMLKLIGTNTSFDEQDLKIAGHLLFLKLLAASQYEPAKKINGPVILIKATDNYINIEDDYGLSKVRHTSLFLFDNILHNVCNIIFFFLFSTTWTVALSRMTFK